MKYALIGISTILFLLAGGKTFAADFTPPPFNDLSYAASYAGQSVADPIIMEAGQTKEIIVKIKNTGKAAWPSGGANYVSAYTIEPNYRASVFAGAGWLAQNNPAAISKTTRPGQTAEIKIKLRAPQKIGEYKEQFYLAAENKTWIQGSYFYLQIKVTKPSASPSSSSSSTTTISSTLSSSTVSNANYKADLVAISARQMQAVGGEKIHFIASFYNSGKAAWNNYIWKEAGSASGNLAIASVQVSLADESWKSSSVVAQENKITNLKESLRLEFDFRAPAKQGQYAAKFKLAADSYDVDGGYLELPITVTADAPVGYQEPVFPEIPAATPSSSRQLIAEPNIRIGLYKTVKDVQFTSPFSYQVFAGNESKGYLPAGEQATLLYFSGDYSFRSPTLSFNSGEPIRLAPDSADNYFELVNYDRHVSWKGAKNFNMYRGVMEFRYSPKSDAPFVINELPLDLYVAGIGETSDTSNSGYIKAILVAARTYAYYQLNNGVPANQRTFDVVATTGDQLYLGYNSEVLMPRVVQAAKGTFGLMVTYDSAPVITPYFGHSDGYTRSWTQVWGGTPKPWLVGVRAKYDAGLSMYGHGVGMSARDASQRAEKDGWTFDQLLKYYYSGTEVERVY